MESEGVCETLCTRCVHRGICKYKDEYLQVYDYYTNIATKQFIWTINNIDKIIKPHFSLECSEYRNIRLSGNYCQHT